jgi:hypothetical protein
MEGQMTDEQINAAIAEACGRKRRPDGDWYPDNGSAGTQAILNYCADLNAMHEAEATLSVSCRLDYPTVLLRVLFELDKYTWYATGGFTHITTTARQRAEAFLRTLDKWEDSK